MIASYTTLFLTSHKQYKTNFSLNFPPEIAFTLPLPPRPIFFFFNDTATTEIYTLSLHDALPILLFHRLQEPHLSISITSITLPYFFALGLFFPLAPLLPSFR